MDLLGMPPLDDDDRSRVTGFLEALLAEHGITWNVVEIDWSQATASVEGRDIKAPAIVSEIVGQLGGGLVGNVIDPGSAVRGIMRLGTASAEGWVDIERGNTAVGVSKILGEVSSTVMMLTGAARPMVKPTVTGQTGTIRMGYKAGTPGHLGVVVQTPTKGNIAVHQRFDIVVKKPAATVARSVFKDIPAIVEEIGESATAPRMGLRTFDVPASVTVPVAQAEAALVYARQTVGTSSTYGVLSNNCATYASGVAHAAGIWTPGAVGSSWLTFQFFKAGWSTNLVYRGAAIGAAGAASTTATTQR